MENNESTDTEVQTNEEVAETPVETPEVVPEETQEAPEQEEVQQDTEEEEGQGAEETPEVSRRMEKRAEKLAIGDLVAAKKRELQKQQAQTPPGMDYRKQLEADDATVGQLEADREQYGKSLYEQGLQQANSIQFKTRLEIDAPKIEAKYPQLDQNSDQFDPVIADALNSHYLNLVGWDPQTQTTQNSNLRYADFVEAQYELAGALATDQVSRTKTNIARQAASTGLRPGGNSSKRLNLNQDPGSMTKEELDAKIKSDLRNLKTIR